ncbi:SAF domain-containing protein [Pseudokineococcus sp. 1T1Z-3]|uniref:SAF domain-containing protein n=1 Tax=Pseudokineococcus sp. 1T1Z-3 TaxID=3132745 RepID=UPI00309BD5A9
MRRPGRADERGEQGVLVPWRRPWRGGARRLRHGAAALLLAVAAGLAVHALQPGGAEGGPLLVSAVTDLPAGHVLGPDDVHPLSVPDVVAPDAAVAAGRTDDVVGRRLASPVRAGEVLTDVRLAGSDLLAGQPPGSVALALTVLPASAALVRPGDAVLVLTADVDPLGGDVGRATGRPPRAVVVDVPAVAAPGLGLGDAAPPTGDVVVLALDEADAADLAAAASGAPVVLALLP